MGYKTVQTCNQDSDRLATNNFQVNSMLTHIKV